MKESKKTAVIIGAGPAGLTAAYELLDKTDIMPVVFETNFDIGGISKTVNYKDNRIDIGGHRFFSKSDKITQWWLNILPLENPPSYSSIDTDKIMLLRSRLSRILFERKFFDYPVSLSLNTIKNLGLFRMIKIGLSYIRIRIFPKKEQNLEDFFINRFGKELYQTFFKSYTQKVWGIPCTHIKPEWGAQRVKGLSITKTLLNAIQKIFFKNNDSSQKNKETSLIEKFMYPKFGPGYMWESVAEIVKSKGAEIKLGEKVVEITLDGDKVTEISAQNVTTGEIKKYKADYFISSMPVKDLIEAIGNAPQDVAKTAQELQYRDFITVGLLLDKTKTALPDNWIYVQEPDVKMGRIQVFNNWSPYLVKNPENIWLGLEYFCNEGDTFWNMQDEDLAKFAAMELEKIGFADVKDVLDSIVIRIQKAYPAYFGSYDNFNIIREYTDKIENLFLIGRNGMHRYNNMDHSMLCAMETVENIINNKKTKDNIWGVNAEETYHESK